MFLYNVLTIEFIQLGCCGTKTHSSLEILHSSRLHDKDEIIGSYLTTFSE